MNIRLNCQLRYSVLWFTEAVAHISFTLSVVVVGRQLGLAGEDVAIVQFLLCV